MASTKPSGGSVVRLLRSAPERTLPIKTLRKAVAQLLGCEETSELKKGLKEVIEALKEKGRVTVDGKSVHLPKSKKNSHVKDEDQQSERSSKKQKVVEDVVIPTPPAAAAASKQYDENGGTRVFLGNLSFKIDETKLKNAIPGITHIKWITDKETQQFYGSAFIELATYQDAKACVSMGGSNILGRPVKATYAPPRPGDLWPPQSSNVTGGGTGGNNNFQVKPLSEKPTDWCKLIFCGNLSYDIDDDSLRDFFKDCGELAKVRWLTHADSGEFKGCGYVEFWDTESADKAVLLNGTSLLGRPIRIDWDSGGK